MLIAEKLQKLRSEMKRSHVHACLIFSEHFRSYRQGKTHFQKIEWLTEYTGPSLFLIVSGSDSIIWVPESFREQAELLLH